jgi:hypothetical protein
MVRLPKTKLPENVKIKSREDWSYGSAVRALLEADCYGKCYICEDKPKNPAELTVDHVIPQNSRPDLVYEWSNLLLACSFCNNNVKGHKYDNIINPALEDPEEALRFGLSDNFDEIVVTCVRTDERTVQTKQLLENVYRKNDKVLQKLQLELKEFMFYIDLYKSGNRWALDYIRDNNSKETAFAAFKRQFIREDRELTPLVA